MEIIQLHLATVACEADFHVNALKDVHEGQFGSEPPDGLDETADMIDCIYVASKA